MSRQKTPATSASFEMFYGDPPAGTEAILFVLNPPWLTRALAQLSGHWHASHPVVAHVVYEIDPAPAWWAAPLRRCDEIWVPSELTRSAVESLADQRIAAPTLKPYPVALDPFSAVSPEQKWAARKSVGLPPHAVCFGFSFAVQSSFERKNPLLLARAFQEAFPTPQPDVCLFIRISDADRQSAPLQVLLDSIRDRVDIRILTPADRISIRRFYELIDCYVSPHRSEGFGFNLFEARQCGLPVIATAYALDPSLIHDGEVIQIPYQLVPVDDPQGFYADNPSGQWAEPDVSVLVQALRHQVSRLRARA
ncbi:MAG: glycosyltransferase [Rhabdaerophilum sp.]